MELLNQTFACNNSPTLDLDSIPGKLRILRGKSNSVSVRITGEQKYQDEVSAELIGDRITVRGPKNYSSVSVISGNGNVVVNSSGSSVSIINGTVYIGGQKVTPGANSKNEEPLVFEVTAPEGVNLVLGKVSDLTSDIDVGEVQLQVTGQSDIRLKKASRITGSLSGQSEIEAELSGGVLDCEVKGQSEVDIEGSFASVTLSLSGQAEARTRGTVAGDYTATASGQSEIKHRGTVKGSVQKSSRGMSDISIR